VVCVLRASQEQNAQKRKEKNVTPQDLTPRETSEELQFLSVVRLLHKKWNNPKWIGKKER
jgi:hypothetical protein